MTTVSLMYAPDPILKNPADEAIGTIMFFLKSPGNISSLSGTRFTTFRELIAKHGHDPMSMKTSTQHVIRELLIGRIGPDVEVTVEIKQDETIGNQYRIGVGVKVNGSSVLDSNMIVKQEDGSITVKLHGNK